MNSTKVLIAVLCLCTAAALKADQYVVLTVNTSSISGTTGSLDFAFNPGALASQAASVEIQGFSGAAYTGTKIDTGTASGGPVGVAPIKINNSTTYQSNDDFETVSFGKSLTFLLDFGGPAVNSPTGQSLSATQFAFYLFSDANGTVPVLTNDASGIIGLVTINRNGTLTTSAVSPNAAFTPTPEPATLGLLAAAAMGLVAVRTAQRRTRKQQTTYF